MRLVIAEGTAEELARFARESDIMIPSSLTAEYGNEPVSTELGGTVWLNGFLTTRSGTDTTETILAKLFVQRVEEMGQFEVKRGKSKRSEDGFGDYLQVRKLGKQNVGALAYLTPSSKRCDLRLKKESASGHPFATVVAPESENFYNVRVYLNSEEAIDDAIDLLMEALDRSRE